MKSFSFKLKNSKNMAVKATIPMLQLKQFISLLAPAPYRAHFVPSGLIFDPAGRILNPSGFDFALQLSEDNSDGHAVGTTPYTGTLC